LDRVTLIENLTNTN